MGAEVHAQASGVNTEPTPKTLASTKFKKYSLSDVSHETRDAFLQVEVEVSKQRVELFEKQIVDLLFRVEARARGISEDELKRVEIVDRVPIPRDKEIKAYYDAHRSELDNKPLDEVKPRIARYLRWTAEAAQSEKYTGVLKAKYAVKTSGDVNSPGLGPDHVLASVGDEKITMQEFNLSSMGAIWATRAGAFEMVIYELEKAMVADLLSIEGKRPPVVEPNNSEPVSTEAEDTLKDKLFAKYNAHVYLKRPEYIQNINVAGAPERGDPKAPVTVVMFSDFQCPHCRDAHPIVSGVIAGFGRQARFIVKNYPLTSVHPNAFRAAQAAAAAQEQGKFFEYIEILYKNQDALSDEQLIKYASDLRLDRKRFDESLSNDILAARIKSDIAEGDKLGLIGTPSIFVNGSEVYMPTGRNVREAIRAALKK